MRKGTPLESNPHTLLPKVANGIAWLTLLWVATPDAFAQRAVTAVDAATESFAIGTSAAAALPDSFKADKLTTERTVGTYAAAGTVTENRGGNTNFIANGIYNFGAGDATAATDRAVGFLASTTATKSGNLYGLFQADPGLSSFSIAYDVEKYRNGTNAAGFRMQLYYSKDGVSFTSAGNSFRTAFAADADNNGFATPPGMTTRVTGTLDLSAVLDAASAVVTDRQFYLAWNYSVSSGSTTANAQALGIDNVSVSAAPEPTTPVLAGLAGLTVLRCRRRRRLRSIND